MATLDAIRAIAALGVLFFHLQPLTGRYGVDIPLYKLGQAGVTVFFVLSGFLIAGSVLSPSHFSLRDYLVRRASRILPLYYLSMALVLLVDSSWLLSKAGLTDLGLHALLVHGLFRDHSTTVYAVWWTLSAEWLYYLIMGGVARWFRHPRLGWVVAGSFVAIGLAWRIHSLGSIYNHRPFVAQIVIGWLDVFGLGMAAALAVRTDKGRALLEHLTIRVIGLGLALGGVVVASWAYLHRNPIAPYLYWKSDVMVVGWPLFAAAAVALLLVTAPTFERTLSPVFRWTGLAYLGQISYGIYVFHPLVIQSFSRSWRAVTPDLPAWVLIPLVLVGTIVISAFSHHVVERPAMTWGRSQLRGAQVRPTAAGTR